MLRQVGGALRSGHRVIGGASQAFQVRRQFALQGFDVADHDLQQIVEIVSEPAGELADGFHLLRLAQRFLRFFQARLCCFVFSDVTADGIDAAPARRCRPRQPARFTVETDETTFEGSQFFPRRLRHRMFDYFCIVRLGELPEVLADHFVGAVAQRGLPGRIH